MKQYLELCRKAGFAPFLWTQFLGAFNDNVFKIVISMLAIRTMPDTSGAYISLIGAVFMIPFFMFSGYAGYAADKLNKRTILIWTKGFELFAMILAFFSFINGEIDWMLPVLFLMALQTTFFSTAKYGILPEMLPDKDLSRANALVEMSTFLAVILGTSTGGFLFSFWNDALNRIGLVLICVAMAGYFVSFQITKVPKRKGLHRFHINPWAEISQGFKRLNQHRLLRSTAFGIAYFSFLGAFLQMDFLLFGSEVMHLDELSISLLGTFLAVGIGIGSLLAGRLSGDKVELGLVPLGSIGMGSFAVMLSFSEQSFLKAAIALTLLGAAGGLFSVPLYAMLQQKSGKEERGQLIGTTNFLLTIGILSASGFLWVFHDYFSMGADRIILILGLFTLLMTPYVMKIIPQYLIRFSLWVLTHSLFRIQIRGQNNVPFRGPALLVCNHVSYVDALLVGACVQRFIRFLLDRTFFKIKGLGWLLKIMRVIPIGNSKEQETESILQGSTALKSGHVVCIFEEEVLRQTEKMLPFKEGFESMLKNIDAPIIPVYLEGLKGSIFSEQQGRFFLKWPYQLFFPVSVSFGAALPSTATVQEVREAVVELSREKTQNDSKLGVPILGESDAE